MFAPTAWPEPFSGPRAPWGRRIPVDLAIVGGNEGDHAYYHDVPLTTVCFASRLTGGILAQMLIERLRNPDLPPRRKRIEPELMIRNSCGAHLARQVINL